MQPLYESIPNDLEIYRRRSGHFMPHVHNLAEIVLCEKGTLEIGVGPELYHMEEGDIAVLFPGLIHHAQCFDGSGQASSIYLLAALSLTGPFKNQLAKMQPQNPVIPAEEVHPDVRLMMQSLFRDYGNQSLRASYRKTLEDGGPKPDTSAGQSAEPGPLDASSGTIADMARVELILSRTLPCLHLVPRPEKEDGDIVYRLVKYMAGHYRSTPSHGRCTSVPMNSRVFFQRRSTPISTAISTASGFPPHAMNSGTPRVPSRKSGLMSVLNPRGPSTAPSAHVSIVPRASGGLLRPRRK